jgi:hypothetical protein
VIDTSTIASTANDVIFGFPLAGTGRRLLWRAEEKAYLMNFK